MAFTRWLLRIPSDESEGRVFCFPYSGVGGSMFNRWPRWIDGYEVCPVQLPARENRIREPHFGTYQQLAEHLTPELLPMLDRPFVFFGHCAGALPAYEAMRLLDVNVPHRLVVSAQVAPHDCPHDRLLDCTDAELVAELAHIAEARGGEAHPALLQLALRVLRDDLVASRVYTVDRPARIRAGVTVVHWSADPEVTQSELLGWRDYADDVRFTVLDGGHYDFLAAPDALLAELGAAFDRGHVA
jgi:surfactin synthase thioesterase subunit